MISHNSHQLLSYSAGVHRFQTPEFLLVTPNIFSIIIAVFFLCTKMCIDMHRAKNVKQLGLQVTAELRVVRMELASCHHTGVKNLEVAPVFWGNLCMPTVQH